jgi:hypothetical protein
MSEAETHLHTSAGDAPAANADQGRETRRAG